MKKAVRSSHHSMMVSNGGPLQGLVKVDCPACQGFIIYKHAQVLSGFSTVWGQGLLYRDAGRMYDDRVLFYWYRSFFSKNAPKSKDFWLKPFDQLLRQHASGD